MKTVGLRFKHLRKLTGLSQLNFAKAIGLSQGRLSDIETNQNKPSADTLLSVLEYSGASADWLLKGIGPIHKEPSPNLRKSSSIRETPDAFIELGPFSDTDFLNLIHQLNEVEKHFLFNLIQFTLLNRYEPFDAYRQNG